MTKSNNTNENVKDKNIENAEADTFNIIENDIDNLSDNKDNSQKDNSQNQDNKIDNNQIVNNKNKKHNKISDKKDYKNNFINFIKNWWVSIVIILVIIFAPHISNSFISGFKKEQSILITDLARKINENEIKSLRIDGDYVYAYKNPEVKDFKNIENTEEFYKTSKESGVSISDTLTKIGTDTNKISLLNIKVEDSKPGIFASLLSFLPFLLIGILILMAIRGIKGVNSNAMSFGNSRAKRIDPEDKNHKVTFKDVAGSKVAKQELEEVVDFLKNPEKFIKIGATIPKGVLLTGSPGTGKTLLARAVAGEAGVPFFHLSGSEFVEMFVGVGASRVRDLFKEAKKASPSIIFIDEIDSIGRSRGIGMGGGNDEREQTLNQILVEMDGFEPNEKVIIIAATNRSDVLDSALLRPGRFDRRVKIDLPDRQERKEILAIHSSKKLLEEGIDLDIVAQRTAGFSGAELYSLINESAISAARDNKTMVSQSDILKSIEKVILGPERRNHLMSEKEKILVAYHEAGHALVSSLLPNADPIHKISIISRGNAGGYTLKMPDDERRLNNKNVFIDDIAMTFGGYAAEELIYGVITTGPSGDIEQATAIARSMITKYGMSDIVGPIAIESDRNTVLYGNPRGNTKYSEKMQETIDQEIKRIVEEGRETARRLLRQNRHILDAIKDELLIKENIEREEYESLLSKYGIQLKKEEI